MSSQVETRTMKTPVTWGHFVSAEGIPRQFSKKGPWQIDWYQIHQVMAVRGNPFPLLRSGRELVRIETGSPIQFAEDPLTGEGIFPLHLKGVVQHLHYTGWGERQELERISRPRSSGETIAVLVLIGKSQGWWGMSQDERQILFQKTPRHEGHSSIGLKYADRIYRRLYHARYLDPAAPYDFITYFEFEACYAEDFKSLLSELRDFRRNPEWLYVDLECEVWMTKRSSSTEPISREPIL